MNQSIRRATPDSEAVASSEDERPWPVAPSFGSLPRKENNVPGLGGGIWSTQKRDSFKMEKAAQRNAAREARLVAPVQTRSGLRTDSTPSPAASEGSGALPFSIPLQPAPKAGRSMSHSQGQREVPQVTGASEHATVLPLGLLAEEVDTESESELGGGLTHTTSHPPIGTLQRTSTFPSTYEAFYGAINGKETQQGAGAVGGTSRPDRRFEAAFANLSLEPSQRRGHWQTQLGWEDLPNYNESRRHSLADIPTRRGSGAHGEGALWTGGGLHAWEEQEPYGEQLRNPVQHPQYGQYLPSQISATRSGELQPDPLRADRGPPVAMPQHKREERRFDIDIPSMYKVPPIELSESERSSQDPRVRVTIAGLSGPGGANRPRKLLYIVSFKCSRVEVFYLLENTGLFIKEGDIVIVEADRGQDLGTVQHADVTPDEARAYKRKYGEEQYKWLMMFSKNNNQGSVNPNAQIYGENSARGNMPSQAPPSMHGLPRDSANNLKPKAIKRLANHHEIHMLSEKEGNEAKAKRTCQQKVAHLHLDMEILDAEWQWDFQKLIFYYYADHYINFKDLITELYRIYKTRIWLSAINPASFSQHALGQPPSGIGPGAVISGDQANAYAVAYGQDPDPYGAVPPYRIGYETYTPNYPAIPGVANSFAPNMAMAPPFQPYSAGNSNASPSGPMALTPTATPADFGYYGGNEPGASYGYPTSMPYGGGQNDMPMTSAYKDGWKSGNEPSPIFYSPLNFPPPSVPTELYSVGSPANFVPARDGGRMSSSSQAPIGTRASSSHSNNIPPPTSTASMRTPFSSMPPPDFIPSQRTSQPAQGSFQGTGQRGWPQFGGSERDGKDQMMQSYLKGLPSKEDTRADEMSRER